MSDGDIQLVQAPDTEELCLPMRSTHLPLVDHTSQVAGWCRATDAMTRHFIMQPILSLHYPSVGWRGTLVEKAQIDAFCRIGTTMPLSVALVLTEGPGLIPNAARTAGRKRPAKTAPQQMLEDLKATSGLINEELAGLIGVSRRALQKWVAGEPISAGRETRLRTLLETIQVLDAGDATRTRARLLARKPGELRPYDLLAEGRFEAAVDVAFGRRRGVARDRNSIDDLAAQLDRREDRVNTPPGRLNARLSGRLKK